METSIRFVRVGALPVKPALCFRARKHAHVVINDETRVRVAEVSLKDHDLSYPVGFGAGPYPLPRIVEHYRKIGERKGITKRAEFFLEKALAGGVDDEADLPPDEVDGAPESAPTTGSDPAAPKPVKPVSGSPAKPGGPLRTSGAAVIVRIAAELKLEPPKLRKLLRSKGLSAPYDDEAKIRKALGK